MKTFNLNNKEVKKFYKIMLKECGFNENKECYFNFINKYFESISNQKIEELIFLFFNDFQEKIPQLQLFIFLMEIN